MEVRIYFCKDISLFYFGNKNFLTLIEGSCDQTYCNNRGTCELIRTGNSTSTSFTWYILSKKLLYNLINYSLFIKI
jgi:hypothetical protein